MRKSAWPLPSPVSYTVVHVQRVNFSGLDAGALKRLGRFYNVPEAHYGCSLDELAYAVATAFVREVRYLHGPVTRCVSTTNDAWSVQVPDWRLHCAKSCLLWGSPLRWQWRALIDKDMPAMKPH